MRVFKNCNFNSPRPLPHGFTYILNLQGCFAPEVSVFPLLLLICSSSLTLKLYFSHNNAAFSTNNQNLLQKLHIFVDRSNEMRRGTGKLVVDVKKGLIYFEDNREFSEENSLEDFLVGYVNETVEKFAYYIPSLHSLTSLLLTPEHALALLPSSIAKIPFLHYQSAQFPPDTTDTAAQIGLKIESNPLIEIDYEQEISVQRILKISEVNSYFMWDAVELEEETASVRFNQPKGCVSFGYFLCNFSGEVAEVVRQIGLMVEGLKREEIWIDDLYDRLYVRENKEVRVSPVALKGHVRQEACSYAELWEHVRLACQGLAVKQHSRLTALELWTRLDPVWKITPSSLSLHSTGHLGGVSGSLSGIAVVLEPIEVSRDTQTLVNDLAKQVYSREERRCYGVTMMKSSDTEEMTCYLVKDIVG